MQNWRRTKTMIVHQTKTQYNNITVTVDNDIVTLWSPKNVRQTAISTHDPAIPLLEYAQNTLLATVLCRSLDHALVLGLGGGAIPNMFRAAYPDLVVDIVEIDPEICRVATDYFGFEEDLHTNLIMGDAVDYVIATRKHYDIVVVDAYLGAEMPCGLTTDAAVRQYFRMTSPGGVLVANTWSSRGDRYQRFLVTMETVFRDIRKLSGKRSGNVLIFGMSEPFAVETVRERMKGLDKVFVDRLRIGKQLRRLASES
ncbi:MAG: fused MFS/spermidine synthase [Candidatus Pacebacteria bacterium]|nr:fused MFS/spermidine synthase [Candidatus Paceibacterota bacterium]